MKVMVGYYKVSEKYKDSLPKNSFDVEKNLYNLACPLVIENVDDVPEELLLLYKMLEIPIVNVRDYVSNLDVSFTKNVDLSKLQEFFKMNESIEMLEEGCLGHLLRVGKYAYDLARELKLSESMCKDIYMAAILHDTGKYLIPDKIVGKQGKLDSSEYRIMKKHTDYAYDILHNFLSDDVLNTIMSHHERLDGSGYPNGNSPDLSARILGIADSFDTMVTNRVYKKGKSVHDALDELILCSTPLEQGGKGVLFDRDIVSKFVDMNK
ncbi:MAG: HD domain-containing protein [Bacilli bacterium]|nr:HD domain-containing protein [Bacilli bacterium]